VGSESCPASGAAKAQIDSKFKTSDSRVKRMAKPEQQKLPYELAVSTRLDENLVREVDDWAERSWRDRSKILSAFLTTILKQVKEQGGFSQSLEDVVRRVRLNPA
jgi:hypothetical protein